jgi:hypothetical protein
MSHTDVHARTEARLRKNGLNYNTPTSNKESVGAVATPPEGRSNDGDDKKFCTGSVEVIGVHQGFAVGTYNNKDGSGGLFITDGSSCFHIDAKRTIHIQTGTTAIDGAGAGGLQLISDWVMQKSGKYRLEVGPNDDENEVKGKKESKSPAYSIQIWGDADIVSTGGELRLGGDSVLINAKEQVKITAGSQILMNSNDGGGKIDILGGEVKTVAKIAAFDLTSTFYVDGAEEVTFNQKYKVDPVSGQATINTPGASQATNSIGSKSTITLGTYKHTSTGNFQITANKFLSTTLLGTLESSTGPMVKLSTSQFEGVFTGSPQVNSRTKDAYSLTVGGTIGTSYILNAMDVNIISLGTITGTSVANTSFIGSLILLN